METEHSSEQLPVPLEHHEVAGRYRGLGSLSRGIIPGEWNLVIEEDFEPFSASPISEALLAQMAHSVDTVARALQPIVDEMKAVQIQFRVLVNTVEEMREAIESRPISRQATLYDLNGEDYRLRMPLSISVDEFTDEVIARFPEVGASASGDSELDAIDALKVEIEALHKELQATGKRKLGRAPARWRRLLADLLEKVE